jgi:hypothetical protein
MCLCHRQKQKSPVENRAFLRRSSGKITGRTSAWAAALTLICGNQPPAQLLPDAFGGRWRRRTTLALLEGLPGCLIARGDGVRMFDVHDDLAALDLPLASTYCY